MSSPAAPAAPKVREVVVNPPAGAPTRVRPDGLAKTLSRTLRWLYGAYEQAMRRVQMLPSRIRARRIVRKQGGKLRLCLGSGAAPIESWLNLDLDGRPDLRWDLRLPMPFPANSVDRIYSEHFIEHLNREDGAGLLRSCRRLLRADGIMRIATPDLPALVDAYRGDWREQDWLDWPGHEWIDSPAKMLNQCFHGWGHKFLYDAAELEAALRAAGFAEVRRCEIGESSQQELCGLETRLDSLLIFEAWGEKGAAG